MPALFLNHAQGTLIYAGEDSGFPALFKFGTLDVELVYPIFYPPFFDPRQIVLTEHDQRTTGAIINYLKIEGIVAATANTTISGDTYVHVFGQKPLTVYVGGSAFVKVCDPEKGREGEEIHPLDYLLNLADATAASVLNKLLYVQLGDLYLYGPLVQIQTQVNTGQTPLFYDFMLTFWAKSTRVTSS